MTFGETPITIIGNLTDDPELRYTPNGQPMARFTIASTPRAYDRQANEWRDGTATFFRCTAWRTLAEHAAGSLTKGTRVVAYGRIRQHNWQTPDGDNRSMLAVEIDEIGPSLRFAEATVKRTASSGVPAATSWDTGTNGQSRIGAKDQTAAASGASQEEPPF
ncbi:single-stranded DNA-binding protein [Streptomyces sp. NPDC003077]|uniref:single-stranded DNA-binding protein n=1 Tax=Streptomyces sp. NPDC003077 TaxID=3154443 RepID=UPI0033B95216